MTIRVKPPRCVRVRSSFQFHRAKMQWKAAGGGGAKRAHARAPIFRDNCYDLLFQVDRGGSIAGLTDGWKGSHSVPGRGQ
ncbi:hypothetical protein EVAR_68500_1 [Eumeta japonica]|uniref:Uncharacterized protein n=1 Tax=Eumeta variegata TaxID=151549 RepID=A0A4C2A8S7_EUMVA|nr:hypothetical protein EVAR_68500_1 [Eumeta japonica]